MFCYDEIVKKNLRVNSKFLEKHDIKQIIITYLKMLFDDLDGIGKENQEIEFSSAEKIFLLSLYCKNLGNILAVMTSLNIEIEYQEELINKLHIIFVNYIISKKIVSQFKELGPIVKLDINYFFMEIFFVCLYEFFKDKKLTIENIKQIEEIITMTKYPLVISSCSELILGIFIVLPIIFLIIGGIISWFKFSILNIILLILFLFSIILLFVLAKKNPIKTFDIVVIFALAFIFFFKGVYNLIQYFELIF